MEEKEKKCPICGCEHIGKGTQYSYGKMFPLDKVFSKGSEVIAEICTDCGYIVSMRVKDPHDFK